MRYNERIARLEQEEALVLRRWLRSLSHEELAAEFARYYGGSVEETLTAMSDPKLMRAYIVRYAPDAVAVWDEVCGWRETQ